MSILNLVLSDIVQLYAHLFAGSHVWSEMVRLGISPSIRWVTSPNRSMAKGTDETKGQNTWATMVAIAQMWDTQHGYKFKS